jgi:hypothetical protein
MTVALRGLVFLAGIVYLPQVLAVEAGVQTEAGGFVTQSQGTVSYQVGVGNEQPLPAFARVPSGARSKIGDNAKLQIVYLRSGRQESWTGKASLVIGDAESKASGSTGANVPTIKVLQPYMIETLTKSREVMGNIHSRQGMIRVRSLMAATKVKEAEDRYAELRTQSAEDDITPEIFLLTTLDGLKAYQSMKKPLAEMLRRQPDNAEAKALHDHFMLLLNSGTVEIPTTEPASK